MLHSRVMPYNTSHNESTAGADASGEMPKLHNKATNSLILYT